MTGPIIQPAVDLLSAIAPVEVAPSMDEATLMGMLDGAIAIVARGSGRVTRAMIEACPTLRVIGRTGAGFDTVDVAAATERKVPIVYTPMATYVAVAEHALALLLAVVKQLKFCDEIVRTGQWRRRTEFCTGDMADHTLGIVGMGKIGSQLARLAQPFGVTILGHDPIASADSLRGLGVEMVELDELLKRSDYVSLHVPLNDSTRGLINRERIGLMKRGAVLVNTARGGVIEGLDVVADALESGQLSAVALDVFPEEPPDVSHRLFSDPRCLCACHMGGASALATERIHMTMAKDMVAVFEGRRPEFCLNSEVLA
jgi:phosphoglycerate dehydrogenase-like enzyme